MNAPAIFKALPKKRGRASIGDGRERFDHLPSYRHGKYFVYAVCFVGGIVKVGRTYNPRSRLKEHWKTADGQVLWAHLFESGSRDYAFAAERDALTAMESIGSRINRSEWFRTDADKRTVVMTIRPVLAVAKATAQRWERERSASAARQALASRLLAEHEAAKLAPAQPEPAEAVKG